MKGYRFELESKPMLAGFLVIIAALFSDLNQKTDSNADGFRHTIDI